MGGNGIDSTVPLVCTGGRRSARGQSREEEFEQLRKDTKHEACWFEFAFNIAKLAAEGSLTDAVSVALVQAAPVADPNHGRLLDFRGDDEDEANFF